MAPAAASADPTARVAALPCWRGKVEPRPLTGGITNVNYVVEDRGKRFFVRVGADIPVHGVLRFNELAAMRAAAAVGLSPEVVYNEPGMTVMRFIEGRTYQPEDVRQPANLERIVELIRRCHHEVPERLRGPVLMFWVFHVIRDNAATLREGNSRCLDRLPELLARARRLERAVGPIEVVFGHNDLLAANFIDDGRRLWLVDWDYAGFNSPLFDLANLASNNEFTAGQQADLLEAYFGAPAEEALLRRLAAMKCASLLRESLWSLVAEIHSRLDFDYVTYSEANLARFEHAYAAFEQGIT